MTPALRCQYIYDLNLELLDTTAFLAAYLRLSAVAQKENDKRTRWALRFEYFRQRHALNLTPNETIELAEALLKDAKSEGYQVEQILAEHYVQFEKYHAKQISNEQMYAYILSEFESMETAGFEKFIPYDPARLLYHSGKFMYDLEDFEKALKILLKAETYAEKKDRGLQIWIFIINLIESIYQQQNQYDKGILYAKKILETVRNCPSQKMEQQRLCRTWQGIAAIDLADMLVKQGKFAEGEIYADQGYASIKATGEEDMQAEFDALLVLVPTKLELGKMDEAANLLRRLDYIHKTEGKKEYYYFKNIRYYEAYAKYYEKLGNLSEAWRFASLARPLQDSLGRRNDARKFEKIQQRHEAEKYSEQLRLVESEKQLQKMLRNAALLIILLIGGLAYGNYHRLQYKRRQALKELESAKNELATFTRHLKEKSELAENLHAEIERLSKSGDRSEYLEKLTHSTILTEEDWAQFRSIFEKVYPDFIADRKTQYPALTQAEIRYLVLEKLQLSTHEMANMLGVSDGTIRQTRMRLKRKLTS